VCQIAVHGRCDHGGVGLGMLHDILQRALHQEGRSGLDAPTPSGHCRGPLGACPVVPSSEEPPSWPRATRARRARRETPLSGPRVPWPLYRCPPASRARVSGAAPASAGRLSLPAPRALSPLPGRARGGFSALARRALVRDGVPPLLVVSNDGTARTVGPLSGWAQVQRQGRTAYRGIVRANGKPPCCPYCFGLPTAARMVAAATLACGPPGPQPLVQRADPSRLSSPRTGCWVHPYHTRRAPDNKDTSHGDRRHRHRRLFALGVSAQPGERRERPSGRVTGRDIPVPPPGVREAGTGHRKPPKVRLWSVASQEQRADFLR
jgi:hypothetical protein